MVKIRLLLTVNNLVFLLLFRNLMKDLMLIWYLTTEISNLAPYILCFQKIDFICYMKFTSDGQIF